MRSYQDATRSQRQTRDMIEGMLDRDYIGLMDESDRAQRQRELELLKRRWPPSILATVADRARRQADLQRILDRGRRLSAHRARDFDLQCATDPLGSDRQQRRAPAGRPNTTAGFRRRFVVSSGFGGLAAGGGVANVIRHRRPRN